MQLGLIETTSASADTGGRGARAFDGHGGGSPGEGLPLSSAQVVLWLFLATVTMLFAAFASSYLVRRTGSDWQRVALPSLVWLNTIVLAASSVTLELTRRRRSELRQWLGATTALGFLFIAGQVLAWHQLAAQGVFLPTNPHSSFFYILTGLHGLHLFGGLVFLGYAVVKAWRYGAMSVQDNALVCAATYWHYLGALWVGLLIFMSVL